MVYIYTGMERSHTQSKNIHLMIFKRGVLEICLLLWDFPYLIILGQQEACDWTGKREAELRVAETDLSLRGRKEVKMEADVNQHGFNQSRVVMIS